jgi:O-antigen/teichoic acid export membrane protein
MEGYQQIRAASTGARLRFLARDSVLYGGASAVSRFLGVFTLPILTRLFSTAEYGAVDVIAVLGAVFASFVTMGLDSAVARYFYETDDPAVRRQVVSQALALQLVLSVATTVALLLLAKPLVAAALDAPEYVPAFRLVALSLPFVVVVQFARNLLKWVFARRPFLIVSLGSTAGVVALTLLLTVGLRLGVEGVFWAQLLGMAAFAVIGAVYCRRWIEAPRGAAWARPLLAFGWPYMLMALFAALIPSLDRVVITRWLSLEAMGLYAVAFKVAMLLQLPVAGFQMAWGPFAYAVYRESDARETYDRVVLSFTAVAALCAFTLTVLAVPLVTLLASPRYLPAAFLVLPLAFGLVVDALSWITGIGIDLSKRTSLGALSYLLGLAASAVAMVLLVGPFGLVGVAWGMFVGRLVMTVAKTALAYRVYPLRFHLGPPLLLLAAAGGAAALAVRPPLGGTAAGLLVSGLLALGLAGTFWRTVRGGRRAAAAAAPATGGAEAPPIEAVLNPPQPTPGPTP